MAKFQTIVNMLKSRIMHGDYALKDLPAERQLAIEVGVSYMTARRALKELEALGLAERMPNGRLQLCQTADADMPKMSLAFLTPTYASREIERWQRIITTVAEEKGYHVRPVLYTHWDDTLLSDTLDGFQGIYFLPLPGKIPEKVVARLHQAKRLVVVDEDFSHFGLPSVRLFPPISVQRLLDHLEAIGHRHIDCFNTQPESAVTLQRIEQWRLWMAAHGFRGELHDHPVPPHRDSMSYGYQVMQTLLAEGKFTATAVLCITGPAAIGAVRALHEAGIRVGHDVGVGVVNGEGEAAYHIPSLTAIESPDPYPYIAASLDWIIHHEKSWTGPLLLQPSEASLVIRESTVPAK